MSLDVNKNTKDKGIITAYLILEIINFIAIMILQVVQGTEDIPLQLDVKYLAIVINTIVTLVFFIKYGIKQKSWDNMLAITIFATFVADYFMTLRSILIPGLALFFVVQILILIFLKPTIKSIFFRVILYLIIFGLSLIALKPTVLIIAGLLYISLVFGNLIFSWVNYVKEKTAPNLMMAWGMTLFFGCDLSIVIRNLVTTGMIHTFVAFIVWVFYVPAQVLIVLSYIYRLRGRKMCEERRMAVSKTEK